VPAIVLKGVSQADDARQGASRKREMLVGRYVHPPEKAALVAGGAIWKRDIAKSEAPKPSLIRPSIVFLQEDSDVSSGDFPEITQMNHDRRAKGGGRLVRQFVFWRLGIVNWDGLAIDQLQPVNKQVGTQFSGTDIPAKRQSILSGLRSAFGFVCGFGGINRCRSGGSKRHDAQQGADVPKKPTGVRATLGGIRRVPLGAKIGTAIFAAFFACVLVAWGFVVALKGRSYVLKGGGYIVVGCGLWLSAVLLW
jgi:hypothetical protein